MEAWAFRCLAQCNLIPTGVKPTAAYCAVLITKESSNITLEEADPLSEEALHLLGEMRAEALRRYGDVIGLAAPAPTNVPLAPRSVFFLARLNAAAVGCAALRPMGEKIAEVRRMYVVSSARRRGIGRLLLAAVERAASRFGYHALWLETGNRQPEAIALYESCGFHRIAPYGAHVGDPLSLCFEKDLPG